MKICFINNSRLQTQMNSLPPPPPIQNIFSLITIRPHYTHKRTLDIKELVRKNVYSLNEINDVNIADDIVNTRKFITEAVYRMCFKQNNEVWRQLVIKDKLFYIIQNSKTKPVLQIGPSCGIAALCMALNILATTDDSKISGFEHVMEMAKKFGFSNCGEMFSAQSLLMLAMKLSSKITGTLVSNEGLFNDKRNVILKHLLQKHLVLIPYDKGPNNEPCLKNGQKAHWAVLTGLLIVTERLSDDIKHVLIQNLNETNVYSFNEANDVEHVFSCLEKTYQIEYDKGDNFELFVFARQGKSLRLHLWPLNDLLMSNDQLLSNPEESFYLLPEGGIKSGLCGKIIILESITADQ